jgi:hypothetical protein
MDKLLRGITAPIWRKVKAQAALDDMTITRWVESVLEKELKRTGMLDRQDSKLAPK